MSEFFLKDKSIKSVIRFMVSENILVEKYQVIIFTWNSERAAEAINRFDYNAGSIAETQQHPEVYEAALLLVQKCMHSSTDRNKGQ